MHKTFFVIGAVMAGLGVALGAFGAHGLKAALAPDMLANFETGVRYQMYHALALLAVAWAAAQWQKPLLVTGGWLMVIGVVIFSGSLYLLSVTGLRWLGAVTPIGGVALIAGWGCLVVAVLRTRSS
jgi:uncharacterized membrane protein YgdD (TMEM256/DUF423 family)